MENKEKIKNVTIQIPENTHKKIKLICSIKGISFKEYTLKLLEKEINKTDFNKLIEKELWYQALLLLYCVWNISFIFEPLAGFIIFHIQL